MRASIIIPAYNSKERLRLNLISLNCQDYKENDIEVIIVDNGSNDNLIKIFDEVRIRYPYQYIRIEKNLGIANGRNKGILAAKGDLLIFHDSDMIAKSNHITKHLKAQTKENLVVCGNFYKRIYSYYYQSFNDDQLNEVKKIKDIKFEDKFQILTDKEIKDGKFLDYSFDLDIDFIKILKEIAQKQNYNLSGYLTPWQFCITNNLSVPRKNVIDVGMFDSNIIKYGYEDYDLGIRLFKAGCEFKFSKDIISVHQEHPKGFSYKDLLYNLNYICDKYNDIYHIDVLLICLADLLKTDIYEIHLILKDVDRVLALGGYHNILEFFILLIELKRKMTFGILFYNETELFKNIKRNIRQLNELFDIYNIKYLTKKLYFLLKDTLGIDVKTIPKEQENA